jgi:Holliday junction resolvase RusA-like endonuclease
MNTTPDCQFFVAGYPRPQGSKRAFILRNKAGQALGARVVEQGGEEHKAWRSQVRDCALKAWGDFRELVKGPVGLTLHFHFVRPRAHYRTGRNSAILRSEAPLAPQKPPDLSKITRAIEDSLSGVIFRDDAQVVSMLLTKRWGPRPGVEVKLYLQPQSAMAVPETPQLTLL